MLRYSAMLWLALCAGSMASDCLYGGSPDVLLLKSWKAEAAGDSQYDLTIEFDYQGKHPIRMVKAHLNMHDALGNGLTGGSLDPDVDLAPGDSGEQHWRFSGDTRVVTINPDDVVARLCTTAVIYKDGAKEEF